MYDDFIKIIDNKHITRIVVMLIISFFNRKEEKTRNFLLLKSITDNC
jgi:hypothetical protein